LQQTVFCQSRPLCCSGSGNSWDLRTAADILCARRAHKQQRLRFAQDIGGNDIQKQEMREAVELPLTHFELYRQIGIDPPRGVLLWGPPGTGKTMLAKAVAHHTTAAFIRVVGSEFVQKYLGEARPGLAPHATLRAEPRTFCQECIPASCHAHSGRILTKARQQVSNACASGRGWWTCRSSTRLVVQCLLRAPHKARHSVPNWHRTRGGGSGAHRALHLTCLQTRRHRRLQAYAWLPAQGPRMVRDVFRLAKENAPAIIFIDEVDAIATARFDAQTGADRCAALLRAGRKPGRPGHGCSLHPAPATVCPAVPHRF